MRKLLDNRNTTKQKHTNAEKKVGCYKSDKTVKKSKPKFIEPTVQVDKILEIDKNE